jgi:hypothetical protein
MSENQGALDGLKRQGFRVLFSRLAPSRKGLAGAVRGNFVERKHGLRLERSADISLSHSILALKFPFVFRSQTARCSCSFSVLVQP